MTDGEILICALLAAHMVILATASISKRRAAARNHVALIGLRTSLSSVGFGLLEEMRIQNSRLADRFVSDRVDLALLDRDRSDRVLREHASKAQPTIDDGPVSEAAVSRSGLTEDTTERPSGARPIALILRPLQKRSVIRHTLTKAFHDFAAAVELRRDKLIVLTIIRAGIWDFSSMTSMAMELGPQAARDLAALLVLHARAAEGDAEAHAQVSALRSPSSLDVGAAS